MLYHNYSGAEEELKKALAIDNKLPSALLNLGIIYYQNMNRVGEAKVQLLKAIELDPKSAEAHYHLGLILAEEKNNNVPDEALAELKTASVLDPQNALYQAKIGWLLARSFKQYKEAESYYRKAIELNNGLSEAHFLLGQLLVEKLGMRKSGDEELRIAHEQNPNDPQIKAAFGRYVGK
jgi:tetratricopeptide (TPR) repeat protein